MESKNIVEVFLFELAYNRPKNKNLQVTNISKHLINYSILIGFGQTIIIILWHCNNYHPDLPILCKAYIGVLVADRIKIRLL